MNLKMAARLLGVHYQTAYRYVRSGELIAVKVGVGYEVSEAAVQQMRSRLTATSQVRRSTAPALGPDPSDVEAQLLLMIESATLTAQPVFDTVVRWLADTIGDACVLRLVSEDGMWLQPVASYHSDAANRALLDAVLNVGPQRVAETPEAPVLRSGTTWAQHHLRADVAIRYIPAQFRQYAPRLVVSSFVAAPVLSPNGRVRGVLTLSRGTGRAPYREDVPTVVEHLAGFVARAIERVERCSAAWIARESLAASTENLLRMLPDTELDDISDIFLDLLDDERPEAVFDVDGRLIAANDEFMARFSLDRLPVGTIRVSDGPFAPCAVHGKDALWRVLLSGDADFFDAPAGGCSVASPAVTSIHWAVVRRTDGTPGAVVAACDVAGWSVEDELRAMLPADTRCWGMCLTAGSSRSTIQP